MDELYLILKHLTWIFRGLTTQMFPIFQIVSQFPDYFQFFKKFFNFARISRNPVSLLKDVFERSVGRDLKGSHSMRITDNLPKIYPRTQLKSFPKFVNFVCGNVFFRFYETVLNDISSANSRKFPKT